MTYKKLPHDDQHNSNSLWTKQFQHTITNTIPAFYDQYNPKTLLTNTFQLTTPTLNLYIPTGYYQ